MPLTDDERARILGYRDAADATARGGLGFGANQIVLSNLADVLAKGAANVATGPGQVVPVSQNANNYPTIIDRYGTDNERAAFIATGLTNAEFNWVGKQRWTKWNDGKEFDGGSSGEFRGDNDIDKHVKMGPSPDGKTATAFGSTSSWAKWLDFDAAAQAAAAGQTPAQWVAQQWFNDVRRTGGIADQRAAADAANRAAADRAAAELALKTAQDLAAAAAATKATTTAGNPVIPHPPLPPLKPPAAAPSSTTLTLAAVAIGYLVLH